MIVSNNNNNDDDHDDDNNSIYFFFGRVNFQPFDFYLRPSCFMCVLYFSLTLDGIGCGSMNIHLLEISITF